MEQFCGCTVCCIPGTTTTFLDLTGGVRVTGGSKGEGHQGRSCTLKMEDAALARKAVASRS